MKIIKQSISKTNWFTLLFVLIVEMILLNILMTSRLNISMYSNSFTFWKIIIVNMSLNIIFILHILDFVRNQKHPDNILDIYKKDVNARIRRTFWILEVSKLVLTFMAIGDSITYYAERYISIIVVYSLSSVLYYSLCFILPNRDNLTKKLRTLKRQIKNKKEISYSFILIDGESIPSSFQLENVPDYKVSEEHIYINMNTELPRLNKNIREFIRKNAVAIIHEINGNYGSKREKEQATIGVMARDKQATIGPIASIEKKIIEVYEAQKINNFKMYHIMAVPDASVINLKNYTQYVNSIKVCDINSAIEFTENLFSISGDKKISHLQYRVASHKLKRNISNSKINEDFNMNKDFNKNKAFDVNETSKEDKKASDIATSNELTTDVEGHDLEEKSIEALNIIYQYNYNNRFKANLENMPKEKVLFEMYKNAYINDSPYQSTLMFFNYITSMCKIVEYYLFAKNNYRFNKDEIYTDIIGDNPPIWANHITLNVYKKTNDILYKNLRERKFSLSEDEEILLKVYLSKLLNCEIEGKDITYNGLTYLFIEFRNKVEAHGIINDANVYAVWNLTLFFANTLNRILKISELELEAVKNKNTIKVGYKGNEKVELGKYILVFDDTIYFIKDVKTIDENRKKRIYINYFTGNIRGEI